MVAKASPVRRFDAWTFPGGVRVRHPVARHPVTVGGAPLGDPQPVTLDGAVVGSVVCTRGIGRRSYVAEGEGLFGSGDSAREAARCLCSRILRARGDAERELAQAMATRDVNALGADTVRLLMAARSAADEFDCGDDEDEAGEMADTCPCCALRVALDPFAHLSTSGLVHRAKDDALAGELMTATARAVRQRREGLILRTTPTAALDAAMDLAGQSAPLFDRIARTQAEANGDPAELARVRWDRALGEAARQAVRAGIGVEAFAAEAARSWARAVSRQMATRPRGLDLFCGAGGASMGYHRAGFAMTGVDSRPQPRYPFRFIQADALEYVVAHGHEYDAVFASPPCQQFTRLRSIHKREYPDLIDATREAIDRCGKPFVMENVPGAPLRTSLVLCGTMFGLKVYRHRLFESNVLLFSPAHPTHTEPTKQRGWDAGWTGFVTVAGGQNVPKAAAERAMGIGWMTRAELSQAIPPAYTEWIGRQLLGAVLVGGEAAHVA